MSFAFTHDPLPVLSLDYLLLLMIAAACSTRGPDPSPVPTLAGSWQVSSTETMEYKRDGSVQSQSGPVPATTTNTHAFTATTLTIAGAGWPQVALPLSCFTLFVDQLKWDSFLRLAPGKKHLNYTLQITLSYLVH